MPKNQKKFSEQKIESNKVYEDSGVHLCYDCIKAETETCPIYEGITAIIDKYFDDAKIIFQVPECEFFVADPSIKDSIDSDDHDLDVSL